MLSPFQRGKYLRNLQLILLSSAIFDSCVFEGNELKHFVDRKLTKS